MDTSATRRSKKPHASSEKQNSSTSIAAMEQGLTPVAPHSAVMDTAQSMVIQPTPVTSLRPHLGNARTHSKRQIRQIADSIRQFGFTNPILIGDDGEILAGHGRVEAAKLLGLDSVPTVRLSHLSPAQRKAYVIADNKLALNAGWDREMLAAELQGLIDVDFDIELTGFSLAEVEIVLDGARDGSPSRPAQADDEIPPPDATTVSREGDVWLLGRHRLVCGDPRDRTVFNRLMEDGRADLIFTDPPYNVPIDGHVPGHSRLREFAMGVGEMSAEAFTGLLRQTLGHAAASSRDGAIAYVCMDWRHIGELLNAGLAVFSELKNLCVWNKTNGRKSSSSHRGGSPRTKRGKTTGPTPQCSKHELVFVFEVGTASHSNTFGLGDGGRDRSNVWDYPGVNTLHTGGGGEDLAMHPTVKPVALVADAIEDCSRRSETVLDPFGGFGTTLIAAERTGRVARLIECDPAYCDTIIRRFERCTGKRASHAATAATFEDVTHERVVAEVAR
jgi:DNA modification methylase